MKRTILSNHIQAFQTEVLMLLRFQFAFNRISKFNNLNKISRSNFVDKLISLKAIENDLVIRICKFDDDTKGVHSFQKAIIEVATGNLKKNEIEIKFREFKELIKDIKHIRRHTKLAHLKIGNIDDEYEVKYNFIPAIRLIIEIVNLMNGESMSYTWSDGRYEKFDLRKEVLG
jgi:hypothetical protein